MYERNADALTMGTSVPSNQQCRSTAFASAIRFDEVNIKNALEQGENHRLFRFNARRTFIFLSHSFRNGGPFHPFGRPAIHDAESANAVSDLFSIVYCPSASRCAPTYLLPILIEQTNACTMYPRRFTIRTGTPTPTSSSRWFSNCLK